jgi:hypothetical protein
MTDNEAYNDFEQGERQALLQVRSFIVKHGSKGIKEIDMFCAQRLNDIKMDARHARLKPPHYLMRHPMDLEDAKVAVDLQSQMRNQVMAEIECRCTIAAERGPGYRLWVSDPIYSGDHRGYSYNLNFQILEPNAPPPPGAGKIYGPWPSQSS